MKAILKIEMEMSPVRVVTPRVPTVSAKALRPRRAWHYVWKQWDWVHGEWVVTILANEA